MLDELRNQIDRIDDQMLKLFEERMQVCRQVGEYKREHGLPVFAAAREEEILQRRLAQLSDRSLEPVTSEFFQKMIELSRGIQQAIVCKRTASKVAHLGIPASYSEEAMSVYFGEETVGIPCDSFRDVLDALADGSADYGILPVENTSTGSIHAVLDLLYHYNECYIVGEEVLDIRQCLLTLPGATLDDIRAVYSHEQGLEQSSSFLDGFPDWKQVPFSSTADSAKFVAESGDKSNAAIASRRAASVYGLEVLRENINYKQINSTRFIVVGREMEMSTESKKISVMFTLPHESGTLYHALEYFAGCHVNLLHIESRPLPDRNFEYMFYVDFEGNLYRDDIKHALADMKRECPYFRILGCY